MMRSFVPLYVAFVLFFMLLVAFVVKNMDYVKSVAVSSMTLDHSSINDKEETKQTQILQEKPFHLPDSKVLASDCRFAFGFLKDFLKERKQENDPRIPPKFERPFTGAIQQDSLCADSMDGVGGDTVGIGPCHGQGRNQEWTFTKSKQIRSEGKGTLCLTWNERLHGKKKNIILQKCNKVNIKQKWQLDNIRNHLIPTTNPRLCVTNIEMALVLVKCDPSLTTQNWSVIMTEVLNIELQAKNSNDLLG